MATAIAALLAPYCRDMTPEDVRRRLGPVEGPTGPAQWVTVPEAAEAWGVPVRTARHWAATGKVPTRRRGAHWRVDASARPVERL